MMALWNREDLPYDAMGDFSTFEFEGTEEASCAQDNHAGEIKPAVIPFECKSNCKTEMNRTI